MFILQVCLFYSFDLATCHEIVTLKWQGKISPPPRQNFTIVIKLVFNFEELGLF